MIATVVLQFVSLRNSADPGRPGGIFKGLRPTRRPQNRINKNMDQVKKYRAMCIECFTEGIPSDRCLRTYGAHARNGSRHDFMN